MKKMKFFVLIFASILIAKASQAQHIGTCYQSGNSASCTVTAISFDVAWGTEDYYFEPAWGDLHVYFSAYIPSTASGYLAYATTNWPSNGPLHYAHYGTGPYSGTSTYATDANGWLRTGYINLTAIAYGAGSSSGVWADW